MFTKEECIHALQFSNYDVTHAAEYLCEEGENNKNTNLISKPESKVLLAQSQVK